MTPSQWKEIEATLSHPFGVVTLQADGYRVTAEVKRGKGLRYCIAVFINGVIEWKQCLDTEAEAPRKFWRERKRYLYSAAKREAFAKKAKSRALYADLREHYLRMSEAASVTMDPTWPNAKDFCRHLRKTCTSVEVVPIEGQ